MTVKSVLSKLDFTPEKEELTYLKKETKKFVEALRNGMKKRKIDADVFVGGSLAKETLARQEDYDVDIFVRFDWRYENLSEKLEEVVKAVVDGKGYTRSHGSRDYFRVNRGKIIFEIIPVLRIKKPREGRNITDLSYFHVNYVKRNLKKEMRREIGFAKKFCKAQGVYGAESYINGFSGYALECLIIYYESFEKMLRALIKLKDRVIIDPGKLYRKKGDVLVEMNEARLQSPIILVDPTWKERNVLAALSNKTFEKFQEKSREFLKKPSERFFIEKKLDVSRLKKRKGEFVHVVLETDRQEGDIAGTKMKKFSLFIERELRKYFEILENEFVYELGQRSNLYLVLKSRKEIIRQGPILDMGKSVKAFKAANRGRVFENKGRIWAREKVDFSGKEFFKRFIKKEKGRMSEMGVVGMRVGG